MEERKMIYLCLAHMSEEGVEQKACGNMHKLVLLDVLCWCLLHDKAQEEVYNQEIHESSIDPVEDLIGCVFEDTVGGHAYDDKIYCPEGYEEIAENLHRLVFLKYRMAACVQPLVVGYLPV